MILFNMLRKDIDKIKEDIELPVRPGHVWSFSHILKYGTLTIKDKTRNIICKCFNKKIQQEIVRVLNSQHSYSPGEMSEKLNFLADEVEEEYFFSMESQDFVPLLREASGYIGKLEQELQVKKDKK